MRSGNLVFPMSIVPYSLFSAKDNIPSISPRFGLFILVAVFPPPNFFYQLLDLSLTWGSAASKDVV